MSLNYIEQDSFLSSGPGKSSDQHADFKHVQRTYKRLNRREAASRDVSPKSPDNLENKTQINFFIPRGTKSVCKERRSSIKSKSRVSTKDCHENQNSEHYPSRKISGLSQEYEDSSLILSPKGARAESYNTRVIEADEKKELLKKFIKSKKKDVEIKPSQGKSKVALYSPYSTVNSSTIVSFNKKMRAGHAQRTSFLKQESHSSAKRIQASPGPSLRKLSNVTSQKSDLEQSDEILNKTAPFKSSCVKIKNQNMNNTFINYYKPIVAFPPIKVNEQAHTEKQQTQSTPMKDAGTQCFTEDLKLQRTGSLPSRINDMSFDRELSNEAQEKSVIVPEFQYTFSNIDQNKWVPLRVERERASEKQKSVIVVKKSEEKKKNEVKPTVQQQPKLIKVYPVEPVQRDDKKGNNNIPNDESMRIMKQSNSPRQIKSYSRPQSPPKNYMQKEVSPNHCNQRESEFAYPNSLKFTRLEMHPKFSVKERFELILKNDIEEKFNELERVFRGRKRGKKVSFNSDVEK